MHPRENAWLRHQQQRFMRPDAARYLRPDAARFLRPGTEPSEVYPAFDGKAPGRPIRYGPPANEEAKYDPDQPRVSRGNRFGGRWTRSPSGGDADGNPVGSAGDVDDAADGGADAPADGGGEGGGDDVPIPGGGGVRLNDGDIGSTGRRVVVITQRNKPQGGDGDGEGDGTGAGGDFGVGNLLAALGSLLGPSPDDPPPAIPDKKPRRSSKATSFLRAASSWMMRNAGLAADLYAGAMNAVDWLQYYQDMIQANRDPPKTLQELHDGVGKKRPGYDDHHIDEKAAAAKAGLSRDEIEDPSNLVSIPRLKHYQITGWYMTPTEEFKGLSPRDYLSDQDANKRRRIGLDALVRFKVLKP